LPYLVILPNHLYFIQINLCPFSLFLSPALEPLNFERFLPLSFLLKNPYFFFIFFVTIVVNIFISVYNIFFN